MKRACVLLLWVVPAAAQGPVPETIIVSGEERQAIVRSFEELTNANVGLGVALRNCRSANQI